MRTELHRRAWFWRGNELRECLVVTASFLGRETIIGVFDVDTVQPIEVPKEDVMLEKPEA